MAEIPRFVPTPSAPQRRMPGEKPQPVARTPAAPAPIAPQTGFEPLPAVRPDMSALERPTVEQIVDAALRPEFLHNELVAPSQFFSALRRGGDLLATMGSGDPEVGSAAAAVRRALEDKDTLEACRLFLLKG